MPSHIVNSGALVGVELPYDYPKLALHERIHGRSVVHTNELRGQLIYQRCGDRLITGDHVTVNGKVRLNRGRGALALVIRAASGGSVRLCSPAHLRFVRTHPLGYDLGVFRRCSELLLFAHHARCSDVGLSARLSTRSALRCSGGTFFLHLTKVFFLSCLVGDHTRDCDTGNVFRNTAPHESLNFAFLLLCGRGSRKPVVGFADFRRDVAFLTGSPRAHRPRKRTGDATHDTFKRCLTSHTPTKRHIKARTPRGEVTGKALLTRLSGFGTSFGGSGSQDSTLGNLPTEHPSERRLKAEFRCDPTDNSAQRDLVRVVTEIRLCLACKSCRLFFGHTICDSLCFDRVVDTTLDGTRASKST